MRSRSGLTDYLERNRAGWTKANQEYTDARASEAWAAEEITWGMFGPSDSELGVLGGVAGKDVIELGCGTAYFGAWLARRGARVTGVDITPAQLETARRMSEETGIEMELIEANAEDVPLPDESFDPGRRLSLVREPENEHDPNAVAIWNEERTLQVGYVPREVAPELSGDEQAVSLLRVDGGLRVLIAPADAWIGRPR